MMTQLMLQLSRCLLFLTHFTEGKFCLVLGSRTDCSSLVDLQSSLIRINMHRPERRTRSAAVIQFVLFHFLQQARAEQEEEFISNTLFKKIQALQKEKETLAVNYEKEEEFLTNELSRKLMQVSIRNSSCKSRLYLQDCCVCVSYMIPGLFGSVCLVPTSSQLHVPRAQALTLSAGRCSPIVVGLLRAQ